MAKPRAWLDTNVVVRLLVGDDPAQFASAMRVLDTHSCKVTAAVLMECEWVLRGLFRLDAATIAASLRDFLAIRHVEADHPALVDAILSAYEGGLDFADALHALQRPPEETLMTFDKAFVRRAAKAGVHGVRLLRP
jgi:predicted nucleic acid-binding protein